MKKNNQFEIVGAATPESFLNRPDCYNLNNLFPYPLQQTKFGIPNIDVKCKEDLKLVFKNPDGSPACVTDETKQKLIERGWAKTSL